MVCERLWMLLIDSSWFIHTNLFARSATRSRNPLIPVGQVAKECSIQSASPSGYPETPESMWLLGEVCMLWSSEPKLTGLELHSLRSCTFSMTSRSNSPFKAIKCCWKAALGLAAFPSDMAGLSIASLRVCPDQFSWNPELKPNADQHSLSLDWSNRALKRLSIHLLSCLLTCKLLGAILSLAYASDSYSILGPSPSIHTAKSI